MFPRVWVCPAVTILAYALSGCVGQVGQGGDSARGPNGSNGDPDAGSIWEDRPDPATCDISASPAAMRLLTRDEYEGTVSTLLGRSMSLAKLLPLDAELKKDSAFTSNANVSMDETRLKAFEIAAEQAANTVVSNLGSYVSCDAGNVTHDCAQAFATKFLRQAYRRPATAAEISGLMAIFDAVAADGTKQDAMRYLVEAALQTPQFLYHVEVGTAAQMKDGRVPLTDYEVASRVAFFVTGEGPDSAMLDAVAAGEFATTEKIAAQTRSLLTSDKGKAHAVDELTRWLRVDDVTAREKSPAVFEGFDGNVRAAALAETESFFRSEVFEKQSGIKEWFTTKRSYFGPQLEAIYGTKASSDGDTNWGDVPRAGLFGQVSWLASFSGADGNIPTKRGKFVIEDLLCHVIPPPPAAAMLKPIPPPNSVNTTRERFEAHGEDGCSKGCHDSMDPVGFAFENFNAIGQFQDTENGKPIDASGEIHVDVVEGAFNNATDLGATLVSEDQISECFATRWFELAMARGGVAADRCSAAKISSAFVGADGNYQELIVGIVTSDAFRSREVCAQ